MVWHDLRRPAEGQVPQFASSAASKVHTSRRDTILNSTSLMSHCYARQATPHAFPSCRCPDQLPKGLGLSPRFRLTAAETGRIDAALDRVGLPGMGARKPGALSGGQQSRAALARALLRARPILLLDEPFSALGPALKSDMLGLVTEIAGETGALVLMVTHDPADARRFADRTVLVSGGIAAAPVLTEELFRRPPPALRDYLGP